MLKREQIQLRGEHNVMNILAAFAIGFSANLPLDAMKEAAEEFQGVAHRLEFVRDWNGVRWYNDSIATAPERTMAAIRSFNEPIVLLLGGRDKNLPWGDLAAPGAPAGGARGALRRSGREDRSRPEGRTAVRCRRRSSAARVWRRQWHAQPR